MKVEQHTNTAATCARRSLGTIRPTVVMTNMTKGSARIRKMQKPTKNSHGFGMKNSMNGSGSAAPSSFV